MNEFEPVDKSEVSSPQKMSKLINEGEAFSHIINLPLDYSNNNIKINKIKKKNKSNTITKIENKNTQKRSSAYSSSYYNYILTDKSNFMNNKKNNYIENPNTIFDSGYIKRQNEEKISDIFNKEKLYNTLNRMLFSRKCIYYYITTIIISIIALIYSTLCFILKLSNKKYLIR